jgi:hypothetical protein
MEPMLQRIAATTGCDDDGCMAHRSVA